MKQATKSPSIGDPGSYEEAIVNLLKTRGSRGSFGDVSKEGLSLEGAFMRRRKLSKLLSKSVGRGEYELGPCFERTAFVGGKQRTLYRYDLVDSITEGVVARELGKWVRPAISASVYSYLKGRSSLEAIADFGGFIRAHVKRFPNKRDRGLYVLRRDISKYGESIPTDPDSPLWPILAPIFEGAKDPHFEKLVRAAIRPVVVRADRTRGPLRVGVPTGSRIQPVICNLYLQSLDEALSRFDGGFYARYGDDILFAHPESEVTEAAARLIPSSLKKLGLSLNRDKTRSLYFTKPGRPPAAGMTFAGTSMVEYLGCAVDFEGDIGIKKEKAEALLRDLRFRFGSARTVLADAAEPALAGVLCGVANQALDPSMVLCHPTAPLLHRIVNSRGQLKHIDFLVALMISEFVTGIGGVRTFRRLPYGTLRREHGLISLVTRRNRGRSSP